MTSHARDPRRGDCRSPTPPRLLSDPLGFLHEDHLREHHVCAILDRLAAGETVARRDLDQAAGFLGTELALHIADEEADLFPLLRRRCAPEDEIAPVLVRLEADHLHAGVDTPGIVAAVRAGPDRLDATGREGLRRYANHARRHLILETAIVLPFARLRLAPGDLETLGGRMMRRRGIVAPDAARDAGGAADTGTETCE
jgi:hemerythrin-like domain-containing protein